MNANFTATAAAINTKQNRVVGACPTGQGIKSVNADGTVVCETFGTSNGTLSSVVARVSAVPIFDTWDTGASQTTRAAGSSIGALINVTADTAITRISVLNEMTARGNLRFVIFDHPAHNRLVLTNPQPFAADAAGVPTWKDSVPLTFTFLAGQSYDVGAIADVAANWPFDTTADAALNITSVSSNANFSNFSNPSQGAHAAADTPIRLWGSLP